MKHILLFLFLLSSVFCQAQEGDTHPDTGYVNIHADSRMALVVNKPSNASKAFIGKKRGFRVQIYNGNDRKKASQAKVDFMRMFPGVRSYLTYANPQFRVRVGDFTGRREAQELNNKLSSKFNPCMVVPDVVNVNTVRSSKAKKDNTTEDDDE